MNRIAYTPMSYAEATRLILKTTGIDPTWLVSTWSAERGDWQVLCCKVPAAPDNRCAVAIYKEGELFKRFNVA